LAAIGLASMYLHLFILVGSGFAWAVMPMVAEYAAQDDQIALRRATRMGLWLSGAFCVLALPALIFAEPVLRATGQSDELAALAGDYLRIACWGIIPALGLMVVKSYLAALEITRPVLWIILASAVVNACVNWVLIFGNLGAPELGLRGAAWASLGTQIFGFLAVAIFAVRALPQHEIFRRFWRVDGPMMARVFGLGWPIGLTTLAEAGLFSASTIMMGWLGTVALAAHAIVLQLASFTFVIHMGISNAATVRAGNAVGRKDRSHLERGAHVATHMSLLIAAITVTVFILFPMPLLSLFVDPADPAVPQVLQLGALLLIAAALFQVVDGLQVIALGLLRGVQDTWHPMIIATISYWGIGLPSSYILGFVAWLDGFGVWLGLAIGLLCASVLLLLRFWRNLGAHPAWRS